MKKIKYFPVYIADTSFRVGEILKTGQGVKYKVVKVFKFKTKLERYD